VEALALQSGLYAKEFIARRNRKVTICRLFIVVKENDRNISEQDPDGRERN